VIQQSQGDNKNLILAIILSVLVIIGWNALYGVPQMEAQRQQQQAQPAPGAPPVAPGVPGSPTVLVPGSPNAPVPIPGVPAAGPLTREAALAASPRVAIETPRLRGSIALRGGRIDDISLTQYRETIDPRSPIITLFSPENGPQAYYAEFGWLPPTGVAVAVPTRDTLWTASGGPLGPNSPVTLTWDNGQGFLFTRQFSVDENYMFTVRETVENRTQQPTALSSFGLVSRHGTPVVQGFFVLHEGLIGVLNDGRLSEVTYADIQKEAGRRRAFKSNDGWLGITDKYWAAAIIPEQQKPFDAFYTASPGTNPIYQTVAVREPVAIPAGGVAEATTRLFAGAKQVSVVDGYAAALGIRNFDLLIDWGWFYFLTKPMFKLMDWIFHLVGNFGVAILLVTVVIKAIFFPLANKSYASMARMKAVQPKMLEIQTRFKDDKARQQQELMNLYKTEKINPLAGCWPVLIQIPVFFALYKVLFVTIEMRHAPFFGWIKDLSAPDPTSIFNLFGLLPFDVPQFLHIGVWPVIMGITMWLQMKMNPEPTDPVQKAVFGWMPLLFTFMLASFSAGLVIYWAWNNILSVAQQYVIMKRQGVKVELLDNIKGMFKKSEKPAT
jgi:YidC/Oxa1 family membrane protein insertase